MTSPDLAMRAALFAFLLLRSRILGNATDNGGSGTERMGLQRRDRSIGRTGVDNHHDASLTRDVERVDA